MAEGRPGPKATAEEPAGEAEEGFYAALLDDDAEALYERAPCGYVSTTPDGTIVKVNETFLTWTGYRRGDLVGLRTFADLLTAGGRIYHETHYAPMLRMHGTVREIALDIVRADDRRLPVLVNSVLERDAAGAAVVIRTAIFDATHRREYERELVRARRRAEESEAHARLLAETLQRTLIPRRPPEVPGLDIDAIYRPAGAGAEVGGDFYDIFQIGDDDWVVAVGDVCGKGVEAAVVTALARDTIRAAAVRSRRPSTVLRALNDVLLGPEADRFCTVALLRLHRREGRWAVTVSLGGHPPPLLRSAGGEPQPVGTPGALLGVFVEPPLHDVDLGLRRGEALVISTDGVTEGRRGREFFGEDRLRVAVAGADPTASAITDRVLADVLEFQANDPSDDIVVVAVRVP